MYKSLFVVLFSLMFLVACDQQTSPDRADPVAAEATVELASKGDKVLSVAEFNAALTRVPDSRRLEFVRDPERVQTLIRQLLNNKYLAGQARQAGFDQRAEVQHLINLGRDQALARAWRDEQIAQADPADFERLARERYNADPDNFMTRETVDVTHILISNASREQEAARALAEDLHGQIMQNPESFDRLVEEYSEDEGTASSGGRLDDVPRNRLVKPFADAAFALESAGDISDVVETEYGFHIIRLDGKQAAQRQTFESVRSALMMRARQEHGRRQAERFAGEIAEVPIEVSEEGLRAMVRDHFGDNLERLPEAWRGSGGLQSTAPPADTNRSENATETDQ